ncbi:MAG: hypothetical protein IT340_13335 [Chloroflexi bacterium]|nr:hypothetical protein [Chloroflexota bacterium]
MRAHRHMLITAALAWWLVPMLAGCAAWPAAADPTGPPMGTVGRDGPERTDTADSAGGTAIAPAQGVAVTSGGSDVTEIERERLPAPGLDWAADMPAPAPVVAATAVPTARPTLAATTGDDFLYVPPSAMVKQPVTVLVALHGVGAEGRGFCKNLLAEADRNGWVVLAPTYRYGNWHDPAAVARDDLTILPRLKAAIDAVPERTGLRVRDRALLYGFSRGGQVAHRFALAFPRAVLGVATLSAGTYTLPVSEWGANGAHRPLPLPFGTADLGTRLGITPDTAALGRVSFWVGVGGQDNRDADVPPAWTAYIGPNRVERARSFKAALDRLGIPAALTIFPGVDHSETPAMRAAASAYLRGLVTADAGPRAIVAS